MECRANLLYCEKVEYKTGLLRSVQFAALLFRTSPSLGEDASSNLAGATVRLSATVRLKVSLEGGDKIARTAHSKEG